MTHPPRYSTLGEGKFRGAGVAAFDVLAGNAGAAYGSFRLVPLPDERTNNNKDA